MRFNRHDEKPLGEILMERGILNHLQLDEALLTQKKEGGLIGEIIVNLGFAKEEDIAHCFSLQYGFPYLPLTNYEISKEVVELIPQSVMNHYCLIPIDRIENTLTVAMANPLNIHAIEDIEDLSKCDIQIFVSTPSDIRKHIEMVGEI